MDNRDEVKTFLSSRRAKLSPTQAGLQHYNRNRRVAGLRRSEVADLAGVSVEYYAQLERGNLNGVSDSVLEALARALQLDEAERAHLFDLAHSANPTGGPTRRKVPAQKVRPTVMRLLEQMTNIPAFVNGSNLDVLAANSLAQALYAPMFAEKARPVNHARFLFLSPQARNFWPQWDTIANSTVAALRTEAARNPYDTSLTNLVGQLCTRSEEFRILWAAHGVRQHRNGTKHFHHPVVGNLSLNFEAMELLDDHGQTLTVLSAEAGSPSDDALRLLTSWAATQQSADA